MGTETRQYTKGLGKALYRSSGIACSTHDNISGYDMGSTGVATTQHFSVYTIYHGLYHCKILVFGQTNGIYFEPTGAPVKT